MRKVLSGLVPLAAVARRRLADLAGSAGTTGLGPLGRGRSGGSSTAAASSRRTSSPRRSSDTTSARSSTSSGRARRWMAERDLTRRLGVDFVNLPMPGDGLGEEWQFREVLKILDDPERRPGAGPLRPGDLSDRRRGGLLSLRTRRMDARGRGGGAAAPDVSLRPGPGLHLCHGEDQAVDDAAAVGDDPRPQSRDGSAPQGGGG